MPQIGLTGDTSVAAKWIGYAMRALFVLKQSMKLSRLKQDTLTITLADATINIQSGYGLDIIRINGIGGVLFIVMGYVETADDVRYFGVPGKGQEYLLSSFNRTGTKTSQKALSSIEYPFAGDDFLNDQRGKHLLSYLSEQSFYTGKYHDFRFVDDIPSRVYAWQIRNFSYGYNLKYEITEPGIEGSAVVFAEDSDSIYVLGELLVRDPDPEVWYMASRTEKRNKATGELIWYYDLPIYWNQSRGTSNATHLYLSYAVLMYNPATGHDQYFPTILKQDKNTGVVIWFIQNDPGVYAGIGGWSVATGYLIDAESDYHYVAWLEWQNPSPDLGYMLRFRVSKISNDDGTTVAWTTLHVLPFAVADSGNLRILNSVKHGNHITYCGHFNSYPEGYYIPVAFCLNADTGEIVWHQEFMPSGTTDQYGHIIKSAGFYNDVKYSKKSNMLILAGAADPDIDLNMTTAIVHTRNAATGELLHAAQATNNGLFAEYSLIHVMNEARA